MKGYEFVRKIFNRPDMPEDLADGILWGTTGYPSFFHTNDHIKEMAYQLRHAQRSFKRGFTMDDIYMGSDSLKPELRGR
jgi:hypothetical protein